MWAVSSIPASNVLKLWIKNLKQHTGSGQRARRFLFNFFWLVFFRELIVQLTKIIISTSVMLVASAAMAEPAPKKADLATIFERFKKAGYSSIELMATTKRVLISGIVFDVSQSFTGNSILIVGAQANSQELARLTAADDVQENKLQALEAGAKFTAICDLAFSSQARYMSFQGCVFK